MSEPFMAARPSCVQNSYGAQTGNTPDFQPPAIIGRQFNGKVIGQRLADGYLDATAMCKANGREWSGYERNGGTSEFINALSLSLQICRDSLIVSKPGRPDRGGGTWVHPQIGYHCAQWCSPAFAVQVTEWIHDIKTQGYATAPGVSLNTEPPPKAAKPRLPSPNAVFRDYMRTMKMIGFSASEAALAANRATVADTGKDILETAGVKALSAPTGSPHLSPSDIGAELASLTGGAVLSGQKVNSLLMRYGFQKKGATKATPWVPTEKGDPFKEWTVTGKKHRDGSSVNWLRWKADIVPALVAAMSATPSTDTTIQH